MKVEAVAPAADASSPAHPDHDRWVKERTLQMEVEHAERLGLTFRDAEAENLRQLERSEAIAKAAPIVTPATNRQAPRDGHGERVAKRGVFKRAPKPTVRNARLSPCGRCGLCRHCKIERRLFLMCQKAKAKDLKYVVVMWRLGMMGEQAAKRIGPFFGMSKRDADRKLVRILEDACDATVPSMGPWL